MFGVAGGGHGAGAVEAVGKNSKEFFPIIGQHISTPRSTTPFAGDPAMPNRTVFFVSDGTGITAETFGNSILAQFPAKPRHVRRPFIDTVDKAWAVLAEINKAGEREGKRPIVFVTLVNDDMRKVLTGEACDGLVLDMFQHLRRTAGSRIRREDRTTASAASPTPRRARNTRTASRPSTSRWRTTTASRRATWTPPMSSWSA